MPKGNTLSKKQLLAPGIAAALMMVATPMLLPAAFAAPTLHSPIDCSLDGNNLNCTADVSGLGGARTAQGTLTATVTTETGCINRGAHDQQPSGLDRETSKESNTQRVNVDGGRATFDITLSPDTNRNCPDGMQVVVTCVTYTDISLTVKPNSGPSRTFDGPDGPFSTCD
jgi:hypothetical protein